MEYIYIYRERDGSVVAWSAWIQVINISFIVSLTSNCCMNKQHLKDISDWELYRSVLVVIRICYCSFDKKAAKVEYFAVGGLCVFLGLSVKILNREKHEKWKFLYSW